MSIEMIISVCLGIGLAASAGFRVFVPLFVLSLASYFNVLPVAENWQWVASTPALVILGVASIAEALGYLIPLVDNTLDSIAVPLAGIAGTLVMASTLTDMSPAVTWALAIIGGGGAAMAIKGSAAGTRLASTATTGGLANPIVSVAETGTAVGLSVMAIFLPVVAVLVVLVLVFFGVRLLFKVKSRLSNP